MFDMTTASKALRSIAYSRLKNPIGYNAVAARVYDRAGGVLNVTWGELRSVNANTND